MAPNSAVMLLNRELSLLRFNQRVLAMAEHPQIPLLEQLRYLCIVSTNLDEFFEIRVASLKEQIAQAPHQMRADGYTPTAVFTRLQHKIHGLVQKQNQLLLEQVLPALRRHGIAVVRPPQWSAALCTWAYEYFMAEVMPLLTPIGLDPARPFPRVYNKSLNFIIALSGEDAFGRKGAIALVQAPRVLPRLINIPQDLTEYDQAYVLLTTLISQFAYELFPGMQLQGCYQWRVTRNSDLFIDEEEVTNLRRALQGELSQRNFGAAVRLEVDLSMPDDLVQFLQQQFALAEADTYRVAGPVNLSRLSKLCSSTQADLLFIPYQPSTPTALSPTEQPADIFKAIAKKDYLLHHPYQSFQPIVQFVKAAATDPQVVAIKQTIYRTGEHSAIMPWLLHAAKAGKEVTVVVELMARFDEQTNLNWAAQLEEVGAHISYGVVGYKTHAKMALVLRREHEQIRRYAHLSTGNYNAETAKIYTDLGLLTAHTGICSDVEQLFSQLTGLGVQRELNVLWQSPFTLHQHLIQAIGFETQRAKEGKKAQIKAKLNALLEPKVIHALYEASQAGVSIDLIVRGACALRPEVAGLSENIRVRSIVGRFLEHARVFYFYHGGDKNVFISSADWMDRNFFRRIEIAIPIYNKALKKRVINEVFNYAERDNQLAWVADGRGRYSRVTTTEPSFNVHSYLMQELGQ